MTASTVAHRQIWSNVQRGDASKLLLLAKIQLAIVLLLFGLSLLAQNVESQNVESQIKTQFDRIEQDLRSVPFTNPSERAFQASGNQLIRSARQAAADNRLFQCLETMAQLLPSVRGLQRAEPGVDSGAAAFDLQWKRVNQDLTAILHEVRANHWKGAPLALRGLVETALGKVAPLMAGSQGFAATASPADGLFYLGQAQGQGELARFYASLHLARTGKAISMRSLLPELRNLQDRADAAFVPPRSIDLHPRFIALNSTLKVARELDAAQSYAGAMYEYLNAVQLFGLLDAAELDETKQAEVRQKVATLRGSLSSSKDDDSMAELLIERAESLVANAKTQEDWRGAFVITAQVIPAYFAARKPATITKQNSRKAIQVTLVRWPFT